MPKDNCNYHNFTCALALCSSLFFSLNSCKMSPWVTGLVSPKRKNCWSTRGSSSRLHICHLSRGAPVRWSYKRKKEWDRILNIDQSSNIDTIWFKYIFNILRSSTLHCKKMWQIFEFTFVYVNAYAMVVFVKSYVFLFFQGLKKFYKGNILFYAICSFRIICISNIPTIFFIKLYTFITVTNTSYVAAANINYCEHSLCNLVMFSLYLLCCILRNFYAPLCTQFKEV